MKSKPGPDGVVVCPTILAETCNYCGKNGHWANEKYCQALRQDNLERDAREKARRREEYAEMKQARTAAIWDATPEKKPTTGKGILVRPNGYAGLSLEDSDDEPETEIAGATAASITWSSMAAKPIVLIPPEVKTTEGWTVITRENKYVKKPDNNPDPTPGEEEAMKILAERYTEGYFERDPSDW
jgi:hypothetical protein